MTDASRPSGAVVVTGGSRGIGAAIVELCITHGYRVLFTFRSQRDRAAELVERLTHSGGSVRAVEADVSDPLTAAQILDEAEAAFGRVDALVNNAGITGRIGPFATTSHHDLRRIVDVNVLGPQYVAQEAVRRWLAAGTAGNIVNISSVAATLGAPHEYVAYAASKAAIETMTVGLSKELAGQGIRVNAVAPGTVYTEIHAAAGEPGRPDRVVERVPMGRIGEPAEIAEAVIWLLSASSSYVTGAVIRASGGV